MNYCSNCGQQNSKTAKFCSKCGNPLIVNDSQPIGNNVSQQDNAVLSDRELLNKAIVAYEEEYATFKKKWTIIICVSIVGYLVGIVISYLLYTLHFRPQFERQLIERYKKEQQIS